MRFHVLRFFWIEILVVLSMVMLGFGLFALLTVVAGTAA